MTAAETAVVPPVRIRNLGQVDYLDCYHAMQRWTDAREADTADELWLVEHPPVFTQGLAGKAEHLLEAGDIPVVQTDRGGQITYHGPGQRVVYVLVDLRRLGLGVRDLVIAIERALIRLLAQHGVVAHALPKAPGVYVGAAKIASLGLRVRRFRSYHGLALNIDMDLAPFDRINPCGLAGQAMTQLKAHVPVIDRAQLDADLLALLVEGLGLPSARQATIQSSLPTLRA